MKARERERGKMRFSRVGGKVLLLDKNKSKEPKEDDVIV